MRKHSETVMLKFTLALALGLWAGLVQAEAYRWTDADGTVHYGDAPPAGADSEPVETFECRDEACRTEQARRYEEAMEVNEQIDEWLDQRATREKEAQAAANQNRETYITYTPNYPIYPPQLLVTPYSRSCLGSIDCGGRFTSRSDRRIHHTTGGGRFTSRSGGSSHHPQGGDGHGRHSPQHKARTYGFPAPR